MEREEEERPVNKGKEVKGGGGQLGSCCLKQGVVLMLLRRSGRESHGMNQCLLSDELF